MPLPGAPHCEEGAGAVELLDAVVDTVGNVDIAACVGRHTEYVQAELLVAVAGWPPAGEEVPGAVVLLDVVAEADADDVDVRPCRLPLRTATGTCSTS
jgi:hypothetical protein